MTTSDTAEDETLLQELRKLQDRALAILDKAETAGELRTALLAVREVRAVIETTARLTGELVERQRVEVEDVDVTKLSDEELVARIETLRSRRR